MRWRVTLDPPLPPRVHYEDETQRREERLRERSYNNDWRSTERSWRPPRIERLQQARFDGLGDRGRRSFGFDGAPAMGLHHREIAGLEVAHGRGRPMARAVAPPGALEPPHGRPAEVGC